MTTTIITAVVPFGNFEDDETARMYVEALRAAASRLHPGCEFEITELPNQTGGGDVTVTIDGVTDEPSSSHLKAVVEREMF